MDPPRCRRVETFRKTDKRKKPGRTTKLFLESSRNFLGSFWSLLAASAVLFGFGWMAIRSCVAAVRGDSFCQVIILQGLVGWVLYTWFNPVEPFLWTVEFVPLWLARWDAHWKRCSRVYGYVLAVTIGLVAFHNWHAFYLPFS